MLGISHILKVACPANNGQKGMNQEQQNKRLLYFRSRPCSHSSMGDVEMGMGGGVGGWGGNDCANKGNPPTQELAPRGNESHHWIQESPINKYFASYNML